MSKSVLYLTYDGLSDPLGQSQILPYIDGLVKKGHIITVISFEKTNEIEQFLSKKNNCSGDKTAIKYIPLKYHKSPPILSTLYDLMLLRVAVKEVMSTQHINIIHCRSYITSIIGLWAKRKYSIKFIFDMRGFWADERIEGEIWDRNNPLFLRIYNFFKSKEKQFLEKADSIISLTENAKSEILSWDYWKINKINEHKIIVIPTCVDVEEFDEKKMDKEKISSLRTLHGIKKDEFIILYLGSLGTWYKLQEMLDYYDILRKQIDNTKFLFLTKDQEFLRKSIQKRNYNIGEIIITSVSRKEVPEFIALSTVSIFFILPTFSKKASCATKMGEIMAMSKPIITNSGWGDVDVIINKKNGVLVDNFDEKSYMTSVVELRKLLKINSSEIRNTAEKYFSLENGVKNYDHVYNQLN